MFLIASSYINPVLPCPLYASGDTDLLRSTYTDRVYGRQLRHDAFEQANISTSAAVRKQVFQALGFEVEKISGVNPFGAIGNGHLNTWEQVGGRANGEYEHIDFLIPHGTRIRLKTFQHLGITADTQTLGQQNLVDPQRYENPKTLRPVPLTLDIWSWRCFS